MGRQVDVDVVSCDQFRLHCAGPERMAALEKAGPTKEDPIPCAVTFNQATAALPVDFEAGSLLLTLY